MELSGSPFFPQEPDAGPGWLQAVVLHYLRVLLLTVCLLGTLTCSSWYGNESALSPRLVDNQLWIFSRPGLSEGQMRDHGTNFLVLGVFPVCQPVIL